MGQVQSHTTTHTRFCVLCKGLETAVVVAAVVVNVAAVVVVVRRSD